MMRYGSPTNKKVAPLNFIRWLILIALLFAIPQMFSMLTKVGS